MLTLLLDLEWFDYIYHFKDFKGKEVSQKQMCGDQLRRLSSQNCFYHLHLQKGQVWIAGL